MKLNGPFGKRTGFEHTSAGGMIDDKATTPTDDFQGDYDRADRRMREEGFTIIEDLSAY